ncbi:hypothetical protein BHAMNSH16_08475 [Brachyspira hampsonii]|uniref:Uncharacterized protein n=1 Tax=Brachyspira hampsonii TaxID=1287055 RepID=A0AAC9XKP1_9SPIR|nr:hypothetical protein [Brachyspira hampsonii]ASJ21671.1 hypothetical protein BHAMNSH16_08475 [Brachyspira hampsonii]MBW5380794.1 hypothetical protein [Brachyspira hampsonii]MBW5409869.1 hypothetical protein [Brachyspira hampsonii]OEJ12930.1 hypothetical protein A9496_03050 [Brachyspira hampsonii]
MYKDYKFKVDELLKEGKVKLVEVTKSDDGKSFEDKEINLNEHDTDGYKFLKLMLKDLIIRYRIEK